MADGIKNKVAIVGMGCTKFGELWNKGSDDLMLEAYTEALIDAGIDKNRIKAVYYGNVFDDINNGKSAMKLSTSLKLPYIPVTRVENLCATGSEAMRGACYAVASGAVDIAMAIGVEKLKDTGFGGLPNGEGQWGTDNRIYMPNVTGPGGFAQLANAYFTKYGLSYEEGKLALAHISWKSHQNGSKNERAHLKNTPTIEEIINSPIVAYPLGLYDCCGVSDGAACAIVCRTEQADEFRKDPIFVKSLQVAVSSGEEFYSQGWDCTNIKTTNIAARRAYEEAGIRNPRNEIDLLELHDCFSITELVTYEDLMISQRGQAPVDIMNGFFDIDGQIPSQTDGGLKCFGHPVAASGLRMLYECYKQLQGKAGVRQIRDPKIALTHNVGGMPAMSVASVNIIGNKL